MATLATGCSPAIRLNAPPAAASAVAGETPARTGHVVIVSIDGLRPDAIARYETPTIRRLISEGRATLEARTILPSLTLPSHTSMLTGVLPAEHGITWNDDQLEARGLVPVPTVFELAREHGLHTAAFFGKAKFRHLAVPGTLDYAQAPAGWWGRWSARRTVRDVRKYLASGVRPDLLFVHIGEPDFAGHTAGWMSWLYGRAVRQADDALAGVVEAADAAYGAGEYTLIVTADHGGHGRRHGSADPRDVLIPWVVWGEAVEPGPPLGPGVRTTDTAATALWLLGVGVPPVWHGEPVRAAFEAGGVYREPLRN